MTTYTDATMIRRGGTDYSRQRVETYPGLPVNLDASARTRVSQITTLFDGKTLRGEDPLLWTSAGTGTLSFADALSTMSVAAGQYLVRQSRTYMPYFSGKSQLVEVTFDSFAPQTGVAKRVGYYSSDFPSPYDQNYDGWYLESSSGSVKLVVIHDGTVKLSLDWTEWDNYAAISGYNWDNFTVILCDFLWLGGAVLRLFIKNPLGGFTFAHCFEYAGSAPGVFMRSPNQPIRYEIRSSTGSGSMRAVCSQVATEGAISNQSKSLVLWHNTMLAANTIGTLYVIKGVRKAAAYFDVPVELRKFGGSMAATADAGVWMLLRNPTLSGALTWTANSQIEEATGTGQTVTNTGRVIGAAHINSAGASLPFSDNCLSWLGMSVNGTPDEIILAYMPLTANQTVNGAIDVQEY